MRVRRGGRKVPVPKGITYGKPTTSGVNQKKFQRSHRSIAEVKQCTVTLVLQKTESVFLVCNCRKLMMITLIAGASWKKVWWTACAKLLLGGTGFILQVL